MAVSTGISAQESDRDGKEWAVTGLSTDFIREVPDYTGELGDQALMGTLVEILDEDGYWVKIKTPEPYTGWVNEMGLVRMDGKAVGEWLKAEKYICTGLFTHVYEAPSETSGIITDLVLGDILKTGFGEDGKRLKTKRFVGVELPSGKKGYVRSEDVTGLRLWAEERLKKETEDEDGFRQDIEKTARWFVGVPYMWGGTSIKNVDCSGLTRSVFLANGILLPRNASQQARVGEVIRIKGEDGKLDLGGLLKGDLLFWGREAGDGQEERVTHVGMYLGNGMFIHSSQLVRIDSFTTYTRMPLGARRIIGHADEKGSGIISMRRSPSYFSESY